MPHASRLALAAALLVAPSLPAQSNGHPTVAEFLSAPSPLSLVAAKKADRIAWTAYERGMRNVYTAAAPTFTPVRLTSWLKDDGIEVADVALSDDGSIVIFTRGADPNRVGWIANPNHDPSGADRAIWAAKTAGGGAPWRVVAGGDPVLSPDGRKVVYVKDGQIYSARTGPASISDSMQRGEKPLIKAWGRQSSPSWSPDGNRIAFISDRENHALIGVYDVRSRAVFYVSPSVDCDGAPAWSADSKQIAFIRRPGIPFGRQAQQGTGSGITSPPQPGVARGGGQVMGCAAGGFGGGGGGQNLPPDTARGRWRSPGFFDATLTGGSRLALMIADVSTCTRLADGCKAREIYRAAPKDSVFAGIRQLMWAGDNLIFPLSPPNDEWDRYYAISTTTTNAQPIVLTTTNGLIEGPTSAALSRDEKTLYYCTNANDIERRHIWAVPTAGGTPVQVSKDAIETDPRPLSNRIAVRHFDVAHPGGIALVPAAGGSNRVVFPKLPKEFPTTAHVTPEIVIVKASDGVESHNQLFLPKDLKPGERRPAMVFVHGGPPRQMLPGYHYMHFYNWSYGYNQWLASQGYVVLSVNYRLGIGYGRKFRQAENTNARGNAEYLDVVAAGKYLQSRPDVDPTRVGIWGLSYGGLLTAQALARNSDLFIAGADLAGVHLYGNALDTAQLSFRSSAVGAIDNWKSPVFLVHGDDDRNVEFSQTVGLVSLLRARNIYYELMVVPDDVHESMLHENWIITFNRMGDFFNRFVRNKEAAPTPTVGSR